MEFELFNEIREKVVAQTALIQETADALAQLDALASLADRALALGYVRPQIVTDDALEIRDGRHPVIEQLPDAEQFVPNDSRGSTAAATRSCLSRAEHGGQVHLHPSGRLIAIMAHVGLSCRRGKRRLGFSTAYSRASERAMISPAAAARSWWRCRRPPIF